MPARIAKALTIAGSDSGGCAGIQADLKTFAALGVHGMSVITAITAQNTVGVIGVQKVTPAMITLQVDAVLSDMGAGAVKSGMVPGRGAVAAIAEAIQRHRIRLYVLDPVMVATSGARLMNAGAERALRRSLLPLALVVTPNRLEAEILTGREIHNRRDMEEAARRIHDLGPRNVLIKGGHFSGNAEDILFDGTRIHVFTAPRVRTRNVHGSGCTLAAAITAHLARGAGLVDAVDAAKRYVSGALQGSFSVGRGPGPLGHFFAFWPK